MKLQVLASKLSISNKKRADESVLVHMLDHTFIVPYKANRPSHEFVQISIPDNQVFFHTMLPCIVNGLLDMT